MMQMAETQEWGLVKRYAHEGSQAAFRALVDRYAGLVYSTCLREVGDRQVAEDATQATFLVLATKANGLRPSGPLSAWLFTTARLVSKNARRRHLAQKRLEQAAMDEFMTQQQGGGAGDWSTVSENLHAAMDKLSAADREAILLRFFEQLSMRETADILGIAEPAAKKRVGRALERLRLRLSGRHVIVPAVALAALLTDRAVDAAPDTCLTALHAISYPTSLPLAAAGHVLPANAHEYAQGALKIMKTTTQKVTIIAAAGTALALLTVGAGIYGAARTIHSTRIYASVPVPPDGWVLRSHYVAGKTLNYEIKQTVNSNTTLPNGQKIPSVVDMAMGYTNSVQSVAANGNATIGLQLRVESVKNNGKDIPLPPQTLAQITQPAVFQVTPRGRLVSDPAGTPNNSLLASLSSTECFPEKAVKPGDTWTSTLSMSTIAYDAHLELKDVVEKDGHKVALIHEDLTRSTPTNPNAPTTGMAQFGFETATVDAEYDVDSGLTLFTHTKAVTTLTTPTGQGPAHTVANTDQTVTLQ